jgi:hypothetical protein
MHLPRAAAITARVDRAHDAIHPSVPRPAAILRKDGTPVPRLLRWAELVGLPIAWLLEGDERPLLIAASRWTKASIRRGGSKDLASAKGAGGSGPKFHARSERQLPRGRAKELNVD